MIIICLKEFIDMGMTDEDYRHFVCIVAGENPEEMIKEYDASVEVKPYVKFKKVDAAKLRNAYIKTYEGILNNISDAFDEDFIRDTIDDLNEMSPEKFYERLTKEYEKDENGNAISKVNPNQKFRYYNIGKMFSVPFITKDGKTKFQARKDEIDWKRIHGFNKELYERVWEMVLEGSKPQSESEEKVYNNMKDHVTYLRKFETKENYVTSSTAFWGYAFLSENTGWMDASETESQFDWMSNYYDVFINLLPPDTLLTIYECHV